MKNVQISIYQHEQFDRVLYCSSIGQKRLCLTTNHYRYLGGRRNNKFRIWQNITCIGIYYQGLQTLFYSCRLASTCIHLKYMYINKSYQFLEPTDINMHHHIWIESYLNWIIFVNLFLTMYVLTNNMCLLKVA